VQPARHPSPLIIRTFGIVSFMKAKLTWLCVVTAAVLLGTATFASTAEPAKEDAAFSAKLLNSLENSDFNAFIADGSSAFQAMTKEQFNAACTQLTPRLKVEHTVTFLGVLKQHGFRVTLWKLSFADGSDDALATLSVKNGKVGGFWIN
jgi:hypothetical protein